jgi:cell division protein FtsL
MKRAVLVLLTVLPLFFFANVLQAFRYHQLEQEISRLEQAQTRLIEENKRSIAGISLLSSPRRIRVLAEEELGLERDWPDERIHIRFEERRVE